MGATTSGVLAALTSVWFSVIHDCQRQITYEGRDMETGMPGLHWTAAAQLYPVDERAIWQSGSAPSARLQFIPYP